MESHPSNTRASEHDRHVCFGSHHHRPDCWALGLVWLEFTGLLCVCVCAFVSVCICVKTIDPRIGGSWIAC